MVGRRLPMALQYANLQNVLFFVGLLLMFGALKETGLLLDLFNWLAQNISNLYVLNGAFTVIAAFLGNIPTLIAGVSIFNQSDAAVLPDVVRAESDFWPLLSYVTALGGSLLSTGTLAGILLMRMEGVSFGWYFRHITPKIFVGFFVGILVFVAQSILM